MLTIIAIVLFAVFFVKILLLSLRITWGIAKVLAFLLLVSAVPFLIWCVLCASGFLLFLPLALLALAFGTLRIL